MNTEVRYEELEAASHRLGSVSKHHPMMNRLNHEDTRRQWTIDKSFCSSVSPWLSLGRL